jgi:hypothetical protein
LVRKSGKPGFGVVDPDGGKQVYSPFTGLPPREA